MVQKKIHQEMFLCRVLSRITVVCTNEYYSIDVRCTSDNIFFGT